MREYHEFSEALKRLELIHTLGPENLVKFRFVVDLGEHSVEEAVRALFRMGQLALGGKEPPEDDQELIPLLRRRKILSPAQVRKMRNLLTFRKALLEAKSGEESISAREVYAAFEKLRKDLTELGKTLYGYLPFEMRER